MQWLSNFIFLLETFCLINKIDEIKIFWVMMAMLGWTVWVEVVVLLCFGSL